MREMEKTTTLVEYLFAQNILVTGLKYPVVPKGEEEIGSAPGLCDSDRERHRLFGREAKTL